MLASATLSPWVTSHRRRRSLVSLSTLPRPVSTPSRPRHEHGRACYWDHLECRWACAQERTVPAPRRALER